MSLDLAPIVLPDLYISKEWKHFYFFEYYTLHPPFLEIAYVEQGNLKHGALKYIFAA